MVSLNEDSSRQGAYFFDQASMSHDSQDHEELLRDEPELSEGQGLPFRRIYTTWFIIIEILLVVGLEVVVFVVPHFCLEDNTDISCKCHISTYSLLTYSHCGVWFLTLLFDQCYRYQQNASRMHGYLGFHRKTKVLRRVPFFVFSTGNAFLLILMTLLRNYCSAKSNGCHDDGFLQCTDPTKLDGLLYLQILVTVEVAITLIALIIYLVRTWKFNQEKPSPDVTQDDLLASLTQTQPPEIGFRDEDHLDEVLEKQADLIHYLKQHNKALSKKIVQLKAQLEAKDRGQIQG